MSLLASAEVRWILAGSVPEEIWQWFSRAPLGEDQKDRWDSYIMLPGVTTVGIKWRQGELQFKPRVKDLGMRTLARGVRGRIEHWEKWSRAGDAADDVKRAAEQTPRAWATVRKNRIERKFALESASLREVKAADKNNLPKNGCNVELTTLEVQGEAFWTFGFEAFSDLATNEKCLELASNTILNEPAAPPELFSRLGPAVTHSYPSWLVSLKLR